MIRRRETNANSPKCLHGTIKGKQARKGGWKIHTYHLGNLNYLLYRCVDRVPKPGALPAPTECESEYKGSTAKPYQNKIKRKTPEKKQANPTKTRKKKPQRRKGRAVDLYLVALKGGAQRHEFNDQAQFAKRLHPHRWPRIQFRPNQLGQIGKLIFPEF